MTNMSTAETAYSEIAREILEFVDNRPWDVAVGRFAVLNSSTSHGWHLVKDEVEDRRGDTPRFSASNAIFFLRDDLLRTTGQRIWGLTFTLFPTGKFNIEYDYNKPDGYEESDETIALGEALQGIGLHSGTGPGDTDS